MGAELQNELEIVTAPVPASTVTEPSAQSTFR